MAIDYTIKGWFQQTERRGTGGSVVGWCDPRLASVLVRFNWGQWMNPT